MSEYKIGEFRANIKKAFDEAARGESVCIDRYGEDFYLIAKKDWPSPFGIDLKLARPLQTEINKTLDDKSVFIKFEPRPTDGFYTTKNVPQVINLIDTTRTMDAVRDLTKKNIDVSHSEQKD